MVDEVIDVEGKIVVLGVIDFYMYYDVQVYWDFYCINFSWYGMISIVFGNCGFGFVLCKVEYWDWYM